MDTLSSKASLVVRPCAPPRFALGSVAAELLESERGIPKRSEEEKIATAFAYAKQRATDAGGDCIAGESVGEVINALAATADKTLTQVGRGTITPAPVACDDLPFDVAYSGGNYANMRKCVALDPSDTICMNEDTVISC